MRTLRSRVAASLAQGLAARKQDGNPGGLPRALSPLNLWDYFTVK